MIHMSKIVVVAICFSLSSVHCLLYHMPTVEIGGLESPGASDSHGHIDLDGLDSGSDHDFCVDEKVSKPVGRVLKLPEIGKAGTNRKTSRLLHNLARSSKRWARAALRGAMVCAQMVHHVNESQPNIGMQLESRDIAQPYRRDVGTGRHTTGGRKGKKSWTSNFLLETSFGRLASTTKNTHRKTSRILDAAALTKVVALDKQDGCIRDWKLGIMQCVRNTMGMVGCGVG